MKKIDQPVLVLNGAVDLQTPPSHGDRLGDGIVAKGISGAATQKVVVPGVNHLLVTGPGDPESPIPFCLRRPPEWSRRYLAERPVK